MGDISFEISIPTDDEGYVLLQCPKCGEKFKLTPSDIQNDDVKDIHCPLCGLISDNYLTEDVIELARVKAVNQLMGSIHSEMKKLERKTKNSFVQFKAGRFKEEEEIEIFSTIEAMDIVTLDCCGKTVKIRNLLKYSGYYCPFCGGIKDGNN